MSPFPIVGTIFSKEEKIYKKLKRKRSGIMVEVIKIINGLEKGKYAKLQTFNNEANNIKNYISKNKDILRPELGKIHVVYRREEKSLYIYRS